MLKLLFKKLVIATWVVLVVGCSEPIDIEASQQHFFEHEENFRQLSNAACVFADANCELFVLIAGTSFLGEGSSLGYVYQPIELGEYEYTEDFFSADQIAHREANRTRGEDVKFSIDLKDGWYLQYHLYP
ncbi:hypothetical protein [Pseudidiomarina sp. CB1]|uniref:hypothetical protein n=1 Tax=Pseudidiomarina sp. CB1 TaxID=2972484 RepID=UPI002163E519|nr:hypothetical protein [Pseudidiomarina sp. CB1]